MIGWLAYAQVNGRGRMTLESVGPLSLAKQTLYDPEGLSEWRVRRRLRKIERLYQAHQVRRLIIADSFPYSGELRQCVRINELPFYRSAADLLALGVLDQCGISPEKAVVSLSAPRVCTELKAAAERLSAVVRGMAIDAPEGGSDYAEWLRRRYGIPIQQPNCADVTVAFGPGGQVHGTLISLYEDSVSLSGLQVTAPELELPQGYEAQFIAALWECGVLDRRQLRISAASRLCEAETS